MLWIKTQTGLLIAPRAIQQDGTSIFYGTDDARCVLGAYRNVEIAGRVMAAIEGYLRYGSDALFVMPDNLSYRQDPCGWCGLEDMILRDIKQYEQRRRKREERLGNEDNLSDPSDPDFRFKRGTINKEAWPTGDHTDEPDPTGVPQVEIDKTRWPEGYGWKDYLEGQVALAQANRMTEILEGEIMAQIGDDDELRRALNAWIDAKVPKDAFPSINAEKTLAQLEGRAPRDVFSTPEIQLLLENHSFAAMGTRTNRNQATSN